MDEFTGPETIFTGIPRSGTTMLGGLANRYLNVGAVNEGPFELWLADRIRDELMLDDDSFYAKLLDGLAEHAYFQLLYLNTVTLSDIRERLEREIRARSLEEIGRAALRLSARQRGCSRLGHEDPLLIDDLSKVLRVFPNCRIVQIVRDPRDVAHSILRFPWGANNVAVAAMDWTRKVTAARAIGEQIGPDRYHEVRYEDLLESPEETMASLMGFVCDGVDEELLAQYVAETEANPRRNNPGGWTRKLTERQIQRIETIAGEAMVASGYESTTPPRKLTAAARRFWRLHHRAVQLGRVVTGKLTADGAAKLTLQAEEKTYARD